MRSYRPSMHGPGQGIAANPPIARLLAHLRTPLYRNGYALMFNSVATSILGIAYWILAARRYSTSAVGLNSAAISTMMFLAGISQLGVLSAVLRFIPGAGRATARFVAYAYLITISASAVISLVFFRGLDFWAPALEEFGSTRFLAVWFIISTMAWCVFSLQDYTLTGLGQAVWVPIENAGFSVAKIILLIGFAQSFPHYGVFASWTIGMALTLLPVNALIFRRLIPRHMAQAPSPIASFVPVQVVKYMAADYLASLCWLASTALLPLMVTQQAGDTANAYFFLSWQIALFLFLMSSNMGSSLIVEASSDPARLRAYAYRVFIQIARMVVPAAAILALGAPYILHVFGDKYATHSVWTLRMLALSTIPYIINSLFTSIARVQRRMRAVVNVQLASCVLVLILSHFLLEMYGIVGVGMAWLISQTLLAIVLLVTTDLRHVWSGRRDEIGHQGAPAMVSNLAAPPNVGMEAPGASMSLATADSWPELGPLRRIDIWLTDGFLWVVVRLHLYTLARGIRDYKANRSRLAAVADLVPNILRTVPPLADPQPPSTWIVRQSLATVTDVTVVRLGPPGRVPRALLKVAATRLAMLSLQRQGDVLTRLRADQRLNQWGALLPDVLAQGEIDGQAYVVERMVPGQDARRILANPEARGRVLTAAVTAISELHQRTAVSVVVGGDLLESWIDEPIQAIRHGYAALPHAAGVNRAGGRLAAELREALAGRTLYVSWVHGDFTPGNILLRRDGATLTGIVDWEQAIPNGLPLLDLVMLLLSVRMIGQRRELGDVVRDSLLGAKWTEDEQALLDAAQAALPGDPVAMRVLVLLCWLRHVFTILSTSTGAGGSLWARRNIETVLQCL